MKRLLILSLVALAASSTGCCRSWSSWFNRGASCDSCISSGTPVNAYNSGNAYDSGNAYNGATLVTPPVEILPGPG